MAACHTVCFPGIDHRARDTTGVEAERIQQGVHGTAGRPAGAAGSVGQPVLEELSGILAGKRRGLVGSEPDPLPDVVERHLTAPSGVQSVQADEIQRRPMSEAKPRKDTLDKFVGEHATTISIIEPRFYYIGGRPASGWSVDIQAPEKSPDRSCPFCPRAGRFKVRRRSRPLLRAAGAGMRRSRLGLSTRGRERRATPADRRTLPGRNRASL